MATACSPVASEYDVRVILKYLVFDIEIPQVLFLLMPSTLSGIKREIFLICFSIALIIYKRLAWLPPLFQIEEKKVIKIYVMNAVNETNFMLCICYKPKTT